MIRGRVRMDTTSNLYTYEMYWRILPVLEEVSKTEIEIYFT